MKYSEKLKMLRNKTGLTQKEFAVKIGLSEKTINNYENGYRKIPISLIGNIVKMFGITADYFFDEHKTLENKIVVK